MEKERVKRYLRSEMNNKTSPKVWSDSVWCLLTHSLLPVCHSNNMMLKRAAQCHSITADSASLSLHHLRAAQRQYRNTQPSLFQPRHITARLETTNRATLVPCARPLMMSGNTPNPARPMQSRAMLWGATGRFYCNVLCTVTKCFSLSYRVTPSTDLCILFLLAVSNHSPAVWFIQTASVISVKCLA